MRKLCCDSVSVHFRFVIVSLFSTIVHSPQESRTSLALGMLVAIGQSLSGWFEIAFLCHYFEEIFRQQKPCRLSESLRLKQLWTRSRGANTTNSSREEQRPKHLLFADRFSISRDGVGNVVPVESQDQRSDEVTQRNCGCSSVQIIGSRGILSGNRAERRKANRFNVIRNVFP